MRWISDKMMQDAEAPPVETSTELNFDGAVANDSESDDNNRYLADCRISLVGFEASEMGKLINMVRKGGGSHYLSLNDKLTHIVIGNPTKMERKDVARTVALGVDYVVKASWLDDCDREKKQVPVLQRYSASDILFPKGKALGRTVSQTPLPDEKLRVQKITRDSNVHVKSTNVFKGKTFCFSNLFPEERRAEIEKWIVQGGGEILSGHTRQSIHYTIECHGVTSSSSGAYENTYVSSHWIRSCLEDGCLLDVNSHILYSPLSCRVPLPGFESLRFFVSQHEKKDRILLLTLCEVLGAKTLDKLTEEVTHLLCEFTNDPEYEASSKLGVQSVTSEWIFECVRQDEVISIDEFLLKEVTTQDREAGVCKVSQFPTHAVEMANKNVDSGVENDETPSEDNMLKDAREATQGTELVDEVEKLTYLLEQKAQRIPEHERSITWCDNGVAPEYSLSLSPPSDVGVNSDRRKNYNGETSQASQASGESDPDSYVVTYEQDTSGLQALLDKALNRGPMQ